MTVPNKVDWCSVARASLSPWIRISRVSQKKPSNVRPTLKIMDETTTKELVEPTKESTPELISTPQIPEITEPLPIPSEPTPLPHPKRFPESLNYGQTIPIKDKSVEHQFYEVRGSLNPVQPILHFFSV